MTSQAKDRYRASKLLTSYGGESDDFFKLWPSDKQYFFSADNQAFIAYKISHKVAVCMGGPVGRDQSMAPLMRSFSRFCQDHGWLILFIQTNKQHQAAYAGVGLKRLLIGADAVINLEKFTKETVNNKYFRNITNRFSKRGFRVERYMPPHQQNLMRQLRDISNSWLEIPHRKEWAFLTGRFSSDYLQQVPLFVLYDANDRAQAFVNQLPSFKPGVATIDLMRRRINAPANSMDYLFIEVQEQLLKEGYSSFNLGMSPLDSHPLPKDYMARLLIQFYKVSNRFIGFKGLHQFKAKFQPDWEPRYVWYQGNWLDFPRLGLAVYHLMSSDD
jgi:phosphatidylglycerol lysyltransferase